MRKLMIWIVRIAVLVLLARVVFWAWEQYQSGGQPARAAEISDFDKVCRITNPDFGSCVCIHRQTNERLDLPYEECIKRARAN